LADISADLDPHTAAALGGVRELRYPVRAHACGVLQELAERLLLLRWRYPRGRRQPLAGVGRRLVRGRAAVESAVVVGKRPLGAGVGPGRVAVRAHALRVGDRLLVTGLR